MQDVEIKNSLLLLYTGALSTVCGSTLPEISLALNLATYEQYQMLDSVLQITANCAD